MNRKHLGGALALAALLLAACGSGSSGGGAAPGAASNAVLRGSVHGGQSPVSGSTITLYAAGISPSGATVLASTTTDANGNFDLGNVSCPSASTPTYYVASGGNPGLAAGTDNSALQLMAALGPCGGIPGSVNIDEVTTVAAAYALNGFIGPSGCVDCGGGVPTEVSSVHGKNPGLSNAMGNAARLASVSTGSASPPLPSASACAASTTVPNCDTEQRVNALANSLAACVNSNGPGSAQCLELFDCATPGATFSGGACTVPGGSNLAADTLTAVLEIARNPGQVPVAGVYDVATRNPVFSPAPGAAPNDWTLTLNISGGGLDDPRAVAIDANGNAWVPNPNNNLLSEFSPAGVVLSDGYAGGGLNRPVSLAIDSSGNVWVPNSSSNSLSKFSSAGTALSGTSGYTGGGLDVPEGVAIDPSGNVWVMNNNANSLSEFNAAGTALSGTSGYTGGGLDVPQGIAIDPSGNVWVTNNSANSLSEFNAAGAALSGTSGYTGGGLDVPEGIAIDPSGNVWVANFTTAGGPSEFNASGTALSGNSGYTGTGIAASYDTAIDANGDVWFADYGTANKVREVNSAGAPLSGGNGYTGGGLYAPFAIAIDSSGDVWAVNSNNSLSELIGAAVPTRTPLVSAISNGFTP